MPIGIGFSLTSGQFSTKKTAKGPQPLNADQQRLAVEYQGYAIAIARRMVQRRWMPAVMLAGDDLEAVALYALVKAASYFNPDRGNFKTYLTCAVETEIAKAARVSQCVTLPIRIGDRKRKTKAPVTIKASDYAHKDEMPFDPPDRDADQDALYQSHLAERRETVQAALAQLTDRQKKILLAHLNGDGVRKIGKQFGMSHEWARKELCKITQALREMLGNTSTALPIDLKTVRTIDAKELIGK